MLEPLAACCAWGMAEDVKDRSVADFFWGGQPVFLWWDSDDFFGVYCDNCDGGFGVSSFSWSWGKLVVSPQLDHGRFMGNSGTMAIDGLDFVDLFFSQQKTTENHCDRGIDSVAGVEVNLSRCR